MYFFLIIYPTAQAAAGGFLCPSHTVAITNDELPLQRCRRLKNGNKNADLHIMQQICLLCSPDEAHCACAGLMNKQIASRASIKSDAELSPLTYMMTPRAMNSLSACK
jgi:hypothetical protein